MLAFAELPARPAAVIAQPRWGRRLRPFGTEEIRICVASASTEGAFAVWESIAQPGFSPPRHVHRREDEVIRVQSGAIVVWCEETFTEAGPGTTIMLPRGSVHTYRVVSDTPAHLLVTAVPGGLERFFMALSRLENPDETAAMSDLGAGYGISFVGPSLQM